MFQASPDPSHDGWTSILAITSAVAAVASAIYAGVTHHVTRNESSKRQAMACIENILSRQHELLAVDTVAAQTEILRCYTDACAIEGDAAKYLAFLNAIDVAALAASRGVADAGMLGEYLRTIVGPDHMVSQRFLADLQDCCNDAYVYEHLRRFAAQIKTAKK